NSTPAASTPTPSSSASSNAATSTNSPKTSPASSTTPPPSPAASATSNTTSPASAAPTGANTSPPPAPPTTYRAPSRTNNAPRNQTRSLDHQRVSAVHRGCGTTSPLLWLLPGAPTRALREIPTLGRGVARALGARTRRHGRDDLLGVAQEERDIIVAVPRLGQ